MQNCWDCSIIRFGGSRSSQSQAAIKTCDTTAASGTEIPDAAGDSESEEEEDPKDDLDPFSSLDHSEAAKSEIVLYCKILRLLYVNLGTKSCSLGSSVLLFTLRHWVGSRLWRGELKGSSSRRELFCLGHPCH